MTPDLAQVALDFCRDVMGWDVHGEFPGTLAETPMTKALCGNDAEGSYRVLAYTDLNAVMAAVREWLGDRAKLNLSIQGEDCVVLIIGTTDSLFAATTRRNLCEALMAACLQAVRPL